MRKEEAKDLMMGDARIQEYREKFEAQGLPFDDLLDDIIEKNGWGSYGTLIRAAVEILEVELQKALAKPAKNRVGRWLRVIGKFFGLVK